MGGRGSVRDGLRVSKPASAPWSRLRTVDVDPLDQLGLPSKGDARLVDLKTQERYYTKIVERYMTFCSDAGERAELLRRFAAHEAPSRQPGLPATSNPTPTPTPTAASVRAASTDLESVLGALRKLREGIVASDRADDFAVQAYLFCIRLSVLVRRPESYQPALLHLLRRIGPRHGGLTGVETAEAVGYLVLDTACRRGDLAGAYALRHRHRLRDAKVDAALAALAHDNYVQFRRVRRAVDGHKARLLEFAEARMRHHTLKCFGRAYLTVDVGFLERTVDRDWLELREDGVGWELQGSNVLVRKVRKAG